jgi:hypothetical protein
VREFVIVLDDCSVHVAGLVARGPTVSAVSDLVLKHHVF